MPLSGFADVLANPLIANGQRNLLDAVTNHKRGLLVTVGAGAAPGMVKAFVQSPLSDTLKGDLAPFDISQSAYEERLLIGQIVGKILVGELMPTAVHWGQSQQLFDGSSFIKLADEGFCLPLYVGPFLYGGEKMFDGSVKAGVRGLGSQYLIDKMVIFRPNPEFWVESYKAILAFITYCRSIGRILGPDETMSWDDEGAKVIRIAHKNDIPQLPNGYIELHLDPITPVNVPGQPAVSANMANLSDALEGKRNTLASKSRSQPVIHPADVKATASAGVSLAGTSGQAAGSSDTDWIRQEVYAQRGKNTVLSKWYRVLVWPLALVLLAFVIKLSGDGMVQTIADKF